MCCLIFSVDMSHRQAADSVIEAVEASGRHYRDSLPMIASENILSPLVRRACNSDLHGRYAEGLPRRRYYQGCEDFDTIEEIGISSAKRVFNCNFANIQSTSGTNSNMGALKALAKPGDTITAGAKRLCSRCALEPQSNAWRTRGQQV